MNADLGTAILICEDWPGFTHVPEWSEEDQREVLAVPELCKRPETVGTLLAGRKVDRLVLGLCSEEAYSLAELQPEVRKAGLDPLGVEIVHLMGVGPDKAKVLLAAAAARALAFAGSKPEHSKMYKSTKISRRSLFRLRWTEYRAVPSINHAACTAGSGCDICTRACPQDALKWSRGRIEYDKSTCEPCGICATACPRGAISDPTTTPAQVETQVGALISGEDGPRGIVYHCARSPTPQGAEGWMPLRLPCVGMATSGWMLAPLLMGAGTVGIQRCPPECLAGQAENVAETVAFCREFLANIGAPEDLVVLDPDLGQDPPLGMTPVPMDQPFGNEAVPAILRGLAHLFGADEVSVSHERSPLGLVKIGEACTGCGTCAEACPTEALVLESGEEGVALTFDAMRCVACNLCVPPCPERHRGAIEVVKTVDLGRLNLGRTVLRQEATPRCERCGAPIAPQAMMNRVEELLGEEFTSLMPVLAKYCSDCRVLVPTD